MDALFLRGFARVPWHAWASSESKRGSLQPSRHGPWTLSVSIDTYLCGARPNRSPDGGPARRDGPRWPTHRSRSPRGFNEKLPEKWPVRLELRAPIARWLLYARPRRFRLALGHKMDRDWRSVHACQSYAIACPASISPSRGTSRWKNPPRGSPRTPPSMV